MRAKLLVAVGLMLFICTSCWCIKCCPTMDPCGFDNVHTGMDIEQVIECYGCPYRVCSTDCADVENYVYIYRHEIEPELVEQFHYLLRVRDGVVISKCMRHYHAPFDFTVEQDWGAAGHL